MKSLLHCPEIISETVIFPSRPTFQRVSDNPAIHHCSHINCYSLFIKFFHFIYLLIEGRVRYSRISSPDQRISTSNRKASFQWTKLALFRAFNPSHVLESWPRALCMWVMTACTRRVHCACELWPRALDACTVHVSYDRVHSTCALCMWVMTACSRRVHCSCELWLRVLCMWVMTAFTVHVSYDRMYCACELWPRALCMWVMTACTRRLHCACELRPRAGDAYTELQSTRCVKLC